MRDCKGQLPHVTEHETASIPFACLTAACMDDSCATFQRAVAGSGLDAQARSSTARVVTRPGVKWCTLPIAEEMAFSEGLRCNNMQTGTAPMSEAAPGWLSRLAMPVCSSLCGLSGACQTC